MRKKRKVSFKSSVIARRPKADVAISKDCFVAQAPRNDNKIASFPDGHLGHRNDNYSGRRKRVIVAMSGGVDSSVSAALLKKQGYDVIGVFMKLWSPYAKASGDKAENICCSAEAATAARAVANKLKIPFYVLNLQQEFKKAVVDYYIREYESGRTPNPCVICNRDIKGEILMRKVLELKGDFLATGHYAKIENRESRIGYHFMQAKDKEKDQTYFLWALTQKHLSKLLFPIGDYTKFEVRQMAKKWQLPTAERRESQGVCFIPDRDTSGFLRRHAKKLTESGLIVDTKGDKLGLHNGLINYTVGQREGLGLSSHRAYYVVKLKSRDNTLVVGDEKDLYRRELIASDLNWINQLITNDQPASPAGGRLTTNIGARIRYRHLIESCQMSVINLNQAKVVFDNPQRAITPGQSIVFYLSRAESRDNYDEVLGGGVIQ